MLSNKVRLTNNAFQFSPSSGSVSLNSTPTTVRFDNNTTYLEWGHTVNAGSNQVLFVGFGGGVNNSTAYLTVTNVSYNGQALTRILQRNSPTVGYISADLWYLKDPSVGTYNVSASMTDLAQGAAGAVVFSGVDQTTPYENVTSGSGATSVALDITSAVNDVAFAICAHGGDINLVAPTTQLWRDSRAGNDWEQFSAAGYETGGSSVHIQWDVGVENFTYLVEIGLSVKAA